MSHVYRKAVAVQDLFPKVLYIWLTVTHHWAIMLSCPSFYFYKSIGEESFISVKDLIGFVVYVTFLLFFVIEKER